MMKKGFLVILAILLVCLIYPSVLSAQEEYVFVRSFPSDGTGLWCPKGLAVDSEGNVYVAEYRNYRIQKFTSDGVFLNSLGTGTTWESHLGLSEDVYIDTKGNIYALAYHTSHNFIH